MAEDTIATLEQEDTETSGWSTMDSGKRDSYVAGLHEQVAAEKAEEAPSTEAKAADRARDAVIRCDERTRGDVPRHIDNHFAFRERLAGGL